MAQVAVVHQRNVAHEVPDLGMRCDADEMVHPINGRADRYFAGLAQFGASDTTAIGTFAAAVHDRRVWIIVAPMDESEPAYWIAATIAELHVTTEGTEGLFKKRPKIVHVMTDAAGLDLTQIVQFYPSSKSLQDRRSGELVAALSGSA